MWKDDQLPASGVEVKNEWMYTSVPPIWFQDMQRDNFTSMASIWSVLIFLNGFVHSEHIGLQRSIFPLLLCFDNLAEVKIMKCKAYNYQLKFI